MKKLLFIAVAIFLFVADSQAQKRPRVSPKDSIEVSLRKGVEVKIVYSRPYLKGRELKMLFPTAKCGEQEPTKPQHLKLTRM